MSRTLVAVLRILLVLVALGMVLAQVIAPLLASELGAEYREVKPLVVPYSVVAIAALLLAEIALFAVWWLLTLASRNEVFDPRAVRWVDLIIAMVLGVALLSAAAFGYLCFGARIGGPLMLFGLVGSLVGGLALTLLVVVLRVLLRRASADRRELAEVI